jgi:hypothetical protein
LSLQVAEEGVERVESREKRGEERQRKDKLLKTACAEAQKADDGSVCGMASAFDWAEDVDAFVGPTYIPDKPTPLAIPVDANTIAAPKASVDTNVAVPPNTVPIVFIAPSTHRPRDLSALRSGTTNPWGSLRRCHYGHHSHALRLFVRQKHNPSIYPTNTHIHTPSAPKSHTSDPTRIFETIRHPLGIGPTKPVIRVPTSMAMDTPMHTIGTPRTCSAVIKSVPRSPQVHSMVTVQCQCGRLVPVSDTPHSRTIPLCHALTTFISRITSYPLFFPAHFFSCLRFG